MGWEPLHGLGKSSCFFFAWEWGFCIMNMFLLRLGWDGSLCMVWERVVVSSLLGNEAPA